MIARHVEIIGDCSCKIAKYILRATPASLLEETLQALKSVSDTAYNMHEKAVQAVFSKTYGPIEKVAEGNLLVQTFLGDIERLMFKERPENAQFISSISSSLNRICDASVDIADIVLPR